MRWRRRGEGNPIRTKVRPSCTIDGCEKPNFGRGMCVMHYTRWRNHGDSSILLRFEGDPLAAFEARVDKSGGCWVWTGAINSSGYASLRVDGATKEAHRWYFQQVNGPVPNGLELDHTCHSNDQACAGGNSCRHRRCVNPDHLEPVVQRENWARGRAPSVANVAKTHCKHGHEFTAENTYRRPCGGRACRACIRRTQREYVRRKRSTATGSPRDVHQDQLAGRSYGNGTV
jgi:hypothetical protein